MGLKEHLNADGDITNAPSLYHLMALQHADYAYNYVLTFYDDLTGRILDSNLVKQARKEEMGSFAKHNVLTFVPISELYMATGKAPIGTRWVDINKND